MAAPPQLLVVDDITLALVHAADGDGRGFERFVALTTPALRRFCFYLGDPDDIDDLTQTTYLRALRSLHTYRAEAPATVWLFGIARRVCADAVTLRQRHRRPHPHLKPITHPDHASLVELETLFAALDPDQRRAFVLTKLLGFPYADAAAICECPIGTIRSRVARARIALAETLAVTEGLTG